jgi:hypothetical protein
MLITRIIDSDEPNKSIAIPVPAGQLLVIVNFVSNSTGPLSRVGVAPVPAAGFGLEVLLAANVSSRDRVDENASGRQITIAGPATVSVDIGNGVTLISYKLIDNK